MKISYRPEIDGLRAIAVISVILYHAQISIQGHQLFSGGFIGVDIFFVISGYLITSIIYKELKLTGSFSFKYFYERRIRRIFPALLFVMIVSFPLAWIYLLPDSFVDFAKSILYSLIFSSNFYFHYTGELYGHESGLIKPFLHTWSLSIEEQFYILFPIIFLFIFKYTKKYLTHILILGFFLSLAIADWGSKNHPSFNFYILPTRSWELLAGSFLAYIEIKKGNRNTFKVLNIFFPSIGLFLILHSIIYFDDKIFHPSYYTLSPVLGVCLVIWFANRNEIITRILCSKFFVAIGLISYSLYLWHYPIFAFARIHEIFQYNNFNKSLFFFLVLILSIFSYKFIELPFRNNKNNLKILFPIVLVLTFILVILSFSIIKTNGYNVRLPVLLQNNYLNNPDGKRCHNNTNGCIFNNVSKTKKVFIIGDSHMRPVFQVMKNYLKDLDYQLATFTVNSCLYFPYYDLVNRKTQKINNKCNNEYFQNIKKILSKEKDSIIIFGGWYPYYFTEEHFDNEEGGVISYSLHDKYISLGKYETIQESFKVEVSQLSKNNKIILIYPIPEVGWDVKKKIYLQWLKRKKGSNNKINIENITTSYEAYKKRTESSFKLLDSFEGKNIYRVYPHKIFCDTTIKNRCFTHDDKRIFYADSEHLNLEGASFIVDIIIEEIANIEFKPN